MKTLKKSMFKKLSYVVALAMVVSIMSVISFAPVVAAGENMLAALDPSFETTPFSGMMLTTDDKVTGLTSGQMAANGFSALWVSNVVLNPSTQYTLSYYFKTLTAGPNKIEFGVMANSNKIAIKGLSTNFIDNLPVFTLKSFTFNTPAVLDAKIDLWNNFGLTIWTAGDILVDDMSLVEIGPAPVATPEPTVKPTPAKATSVSISAVTDKTITLSGKTTPSLRTFTIKYGSTSKVITSTTSGKWTLKLSKVLTVGTKISLVYTSTKSVYVGATAPTVNTVTSKSTSISGKTYKSGVVSIKVGTKTYTVKASSSTGLFKQKLAKTLKKGSKFTVKVKSNGQTSPLKTVIVK